MMMSSEIDTKYNNVLEWIASQMLPLFSIFNSIFYV